MTANRSDFIAELTQSIAREATAKDGGSPQGQAIKADLNTLAEQLVEAMVNRDEATVAKAYEAVERSYSEIVASCGLGEQAFDALTTAAELRGLTRFLGAAVQHRTLPQATDALGEVAYRRLLDKLYHAPNGLESGRLAQAAGYAAATVARRLPELRSIGLVRSQQVGKTMVNRLTADARKRMTELYAKEAEEAAKDDAAATGPKSAYGRYHLGARMPDNVGLVAAAMVHGKTVKVDSSVSLKAARRVGVPATCDVYIHARDDVSQQNARSVAELILKKAMLTGLCTINDQVTNNLDIHFRGDKIYANISASSDDDVGFLIQGS